MCIILCILDILCNACTLFDHVPSSLYIATCSLYDGNVLLYDARVDKKAMVRNRYNRTSISCPKHHKERDIYN